MLQQRAVALGRPSCGPGTAAPRQMHAAQSKRVLFKRSMIPKAGANSKPFTSEDWKAHGVDVLKKTLDPGIKEQLTQYGELVQATYDNLGLNPCDHAQYGNALETPDKLLAYTQGNYRVAQGHEGPKQSTYARYILPQGFKDTKLGTVVSPMIAALPGKGEEGGLPNPGEVLAGDLRTALINKFFATVPGLLVNVIDGNNGGRALFTKKEDGRTKEPRGTFFAYVAVSQPPKSNADAAAPKTTTGAAAAEQGQDLAIVWRGTIFKEEWESNFAQDQLALWDPDKVIDGAKNSTTSLAAQSKILPKSSEVGVHAGFDDLYTRRFTKRMTDPQKTEGGGEKVEEVPSPREIVHAWLPQLLKHHNVATITATGHSLGGVLATLCAFDVAQHLEQNWDKWDKADWKTAKRPQVRLVTFGSPRLGNATFVETFHNLGIAALRIENKGDIVPQVPGIWVQALTGVVEKVSDEAALDTTNPITAFFRKSYRFTSRLSEYVNVPSQWGYFHVGQALQLDCDWAADMLDVEPFGRKHNLELYLYLMSLLGQNGIEKQTSRNPLLLNKSDDVLSDKSYPADWWRQPNKRRYRKDKDGYWVYP